METWTEKQNRLLKERVKTLEKLLADTQDCLSAITYQCNQLNRVAIAAENINNKITEEYSD